MKRRTTQTILLFLLAPMISAPLHAVEPMSEEAMGSMALESGQDFIQIYGPTSAGLTIDIDDESDSKKTSASESADDTAIAATKQTIADLEKQLIEEFETAKASGDTDIGQAALLKGDSIIVGQAGAFDTTSEISYKDGAFKHDAKFNKDGSVEHTRNLQVDMLKFENLSSDAANDNSFGSIYISDWSSRGTNTTTER